MSNQIAHQIAKQDSVRGTSQLRQQAVTFDAGGGNTWMVEMDAGVDADLPDVPFLRIRKVDSSGVAIGASGVVLIDLASLTALGLPSPVFAKFRQLNWNDATTCVEYKAAFLMTEPEPA